MKNITYVCFIVMWYYLADIIFYGFSKKIYFQINAEMDGRDVLEGFESLCRGGIFLGLIIFLGGPYISLTLHMLFNNRKTRLLFYFITITSFLLGVFVAYFSIFFLE
jgi:hypothetical protein